MCEIVDVEPFQLTTPSTISSMPRVFLHPTPTFYIIWIFVNERVFQSSCTSSWPGHVLILLSMSWSVDVPPGIFALPLSSRNILPRKRQRQQLISIRAPQPRPTTTPPLPLQSAQHLPLPPHPKASISIIPLPPDVYVLFHRNLSISKLTKIPTNSSPFVEWWLRSILRGRRTPNGRWTPKRLRLNTIFCLSVWIFFDFSLSSVSFHFSVGKPRLRIDINFMCLLALVTISHGWLMAGWLVMAHGVRGAWFELVRWDSPNGFRRRTISSSAFFNLNPTKCPRSDTKWIRQWLSLKFTRRPATYWTSIKIEVDAKLDFFSFLRLFHTALLSRWYAILSFAIVCAGLGDDPVTISCKKLTHQLKLVMLCQTVSAELNI